MPIEYLIYLVLLLQVLILFFLFFKKGGENQKQLLLEEFSKITKELTFSLQENRKEVSERLTQQFQLVFESQRAGAKDQGEALRLFGDTVRQSMRDLQEMQREKFSELNRRQEERKCPKAISS